MPLGLSPAQKEPVVLKIIASENVFRFIITGQFQKAQLRVFSLSGKEVFQKEFNSNNRYWNGLDNNNQKIANDVYLYILTTENEKKVGKIIILR